jgi:hypothetical protein
MRSTRRQLRTGGKGVSARSRRAAFGAEGAGGLTRRLPTSQPIAALTRSRRVRWLAKEAHRLVRGEANFPCLCRESRQGVLARIAEG